MGYWPNCACPIEYRIHLNLWLFALFFLCSCFCVIQKARQCWFHTPDVRLLPVIAESKSSDGDLRMEEQEEEQEKEVEKEEGQEEGQEEKEAEEVEEGAEIKTVGSIVSSGNDGEPLPVAHQKQQQQKQHQDTDADAAPRSPPHTHEDGEDGAPVLPRALSSEGDRPSPPVESGDTEGISASDGAPSDGDQAAASADSPVRFKKIINNNNYIKMTHKKKNKNKQSSTIRGK